MRAQAVYERAGYRREHFYKILNKKDVSVEEFERITSALGKKPGDLLDNSHADLTPILPLIEQLKAFHPDALPRVAVLLASLKQFVADTWLTGRPEINLDESRYGVEHSAKQTKPAPDEDAPPQRYGVDEGVAARSGIPNDPRRYRETPPPSRKSRR